MDKDCIVGTNQQSASCAEGGGSPKILSKLTIDEDETQNSAKIPTMDGGSREVKEDEGSSRHKKTKQQAAEEHMPCAVDTHSAVEISSNTTGGSTAKRKRAANKKEPRKQTRLSQRAQFDAKYREENLLAKGGYGFVFAGHRIADNLPVAIKHIPKKNVILKHVNKNGEKIPMELAIMMHLAEESNGSVGISAPVALLDWYNQRWELILVMERPVPCEDLLQYINNKGGSLPEEEAKIIMKQCVDVVTDLLDKGIFYRDIKAENILIETSYDEPRVRLIDFGLSCFSEKDCLYNLYYGNFHRRPPECHNKCSYSPGPFIVWHMGALLYEMLHTPTFFLTMNLLDEGMNFKKDLSPAGRNFINMSLAKDPNKRITLEQLKSHPWMLGLSPCDE